MKKYEAALLDLEGVLVDHTRLQPEVVTRALQAAGFTPHFKVKSIYYLRSSPEIHDSRVFLKAMIALCKARYPIKKLKRMNHQEAEAELLKLSAELPGEIEEVVGTALSTYQQLRQDKTFFLRHIRPISGTKKLLRELRRNGVKVAIVTNANPFLAHAILEHYDLKALVHEVVTEEESGAEKPSPIPWQHAARKLGVPMKKCVVVDDSAGGILGGIRAKAGLTIGVLTGNGRREAFRALKPQPHKIEKRAVDVLRHV